MTPSLSVVIPSYNAVRHLPAVLDALDRAAREGLALEIVVVDGGSANRSAALARERGARVIASRRGRGTQLAAGAEAATGAWLLFLHADSVPGPGWAAEVRAFMDRAENRERAAVFRFALDDGSAAARRLERVVAWRSRTLVLPYGDQGLLIAAAFYRRLGGYKRIPIMEDVDIVRRIGRGRLVHLDAAAVTSAERYRHGGWILRPLRNLSCLGLYFLGLPPRLIARLYAPPGPP